MIANGNDLGQMLHDEKTQLPAQPGSSVLSNTLGLASEGSSMDELDRLTKRRRPKQHENHGRQSQIVAASYSRFSSDQQRESSITDQQRECREAAEKNAHTIDPNLEFSDSAVSGTKLERDGLDAMLREAEEGKFQVLYMHSLSRLGRESVIMMPILKKLVHTQGVRVISVTEGIDTDRQGWELIASLLSVMHERYIKDLAANVLRGQEGTLLSNFGVGDHRFGYKSEAIPNSATARRGRGSKPRMRYVIDEEQAAWVRQIFKWFVQERRSLTWITKQLNIQKVPKDHRSKTARWWHQQVTGVLRSPKYIGIWRWGERKNVRDPLTGKVRQVYRADEEAERWVRRFPELAIISQEQFLAAQVLLEQNFNRYSEFRKGNGRLRPDKQGRPQPGPRKLLTQLIRCAACGSVFYHTGAGGYSYMQCPNYRKGLCKCKTALHTKQAEHLILDTIGRRILADEAWRQAVFNELTAAWRAEEEQVPTELESVQRSIRSLQTRIDSLLNQIEDGAKDELIVGRLAQRREELSKLKSQERELSKRREAQTAMPTEVWMERQLEQLGATLVGATPAAVIALRQIVGGMIVVRELQRPNGKRNYLQGEWQMQVATVASAISPGLQIQASKSPQAPIVNSETVTVDFIEPELVDPRLERAKALYDQGEINVLIAKELGCSKSKVTSLLRKAFGNLGQEMPDGRGRRSQLSRKHIETPFYQRISEDVFQLYSQGVLLQDMTERFKTNRTTLRSAARFAFDKRGLEFPDGRTRRKSLPRKGRSRRKAKPLDLQVKHEGLSD